MSKSESRLAKRIRPSGGQNAFDRLLLGFEWDTELDQGFMITLSEAVRDIADLPRCIEIRASEKEIDDPQSAFAELKNTSDIVHIIGDDGEGAEVVDSLKSIELNIHKKGFMFQLNDVAHSDWVKSKSFALKTSEVVIDKLLDLVTPSSVGLKVITSFEFERELSFSEILNTESKWIPQSVFEGNSYWRFEHSFYEPLAKGKAIKTTFHLMHSPAAQNQDKLVISCLHRLIYGDPDSVSLDTLSSEYDTLYKKNETLISSLLSEGVVELFGLRPEGNNYAS
ncbi:MULTISPECIES: hypothetical protein [Pseudomonas syringae group]|uniref:Uncharacterized protein n=1 Tax=Pseudomonas syringae pv. ribicola TaxID=55398 RepID=A0A0P9ZAL5_PSESI|nr:MULTISPECIES: hypothetical protein [Pseudomonas syringae group]EKN46676.1 hypothetical protein AAI_10291 [Pseudomonas viridiflava UASWS0038]KPY43634.1 Uncharacterized protein ALO47_02653 [Pseudomonas syringae pv. ribicola]KPZ17258.1 hypothetical protein ALO56_200234 [Pseudomonas viridiflava]MBI6681422.1 hypothetical protein [Pseudomonas viridiflava]OAG90949.1 hypothetical protein AO065_15040 [Pseudomonas viridiflava]